MKHLLIFTIILSTLLSTEVYGQSKAVKKYLREQDDQLKKEFPPALTEQYPMGSLGEKIQTLYETQAEKACGIKRDDQRLYIPREIVNGYGQNRLKNTKIYDIPISATNLLFLALTPSDITKIDNGTLVESEYINAKRVVGIKDNLVDYGQSVLTPIGGFPSLFYQKSCGSYFVGDLGASVKAPVLELEASLNAETKKSTSITTITGKFFSPLYLIFRQNTAQSVYAHMLLWEVYAEQEKNARSLGQTDFLINNGKYISEFNATLTNRATDSDQSLNMNGRLSTNISAGIFSANGNIQAGYENKVSFSLKDFNTSIHKLADGKLSYAKSDLPRVDVINQKLQNSLNFNPQPSFNGFVTHLLPTEISRVLTGIPAYLCDKTSWVIDANGYDKSLWKEKPTVTSLYSPGKDGSYPDCICKVTGFLKKTAINQAIKDKGSLQLQMSLINVLTVDSKQLKIDIYEPSVKVTDAPKILTINSEPVNASRQEIRTSTKVSYNYPISFLVDDTGIKLTEPYEISNIQIEFINQEQSDLLSNSVSNHQVKGNSIFVDIKTVEKPKEYIQEGQLTVPVKIKFSIQLSGGSTTQLATNTINLSVPNLIEKVEVETKVTVEADPKNE
jgi:hypothetical protein